MSPQFHREYQMKAMSLVENSLAASAYSSNLIANTANTTNMLIK